MAIEFGKALEEEEQRIVSREIRPDDEQEASLRPHFLTDYTGQDPEVNLPSSVTGLAVDNSQTPRSRRFSMGITVNF